MKVSEDRGESMATLPERETKRHPVARRVDPRLDAAAWPRRSRGNGEARPGPTKYSRTACCGKVKDRLTASVERRPLVLDADEHLIAGVGAEFRRDPNGTRRKWRCRRDVVKGPAGTRHENDGVPVLAWQRRSTRVVDSMLHRGASIIQPAKIDPVRTVLGESASSLEVGDIDERRSRRATS